MEMSNFQPLPLYIDQALVRARWDVGEHENPK